MPTEKALGVLLRLHVLSSIINVFWDCLPAQQLQLGNILDTHNGKQEYLRQSTPSNPLMNSDNLNLTTKPKNYVFSILFIENLSSAKRKLLPNPTTFHLTQNT